MKMVQARMELMGNNELKYGSSYPGADKIAMLDKAIAELTEYKEKIAANPSDYDDGEGARYTMSIELMKVNTPPIV